MGLFETTKHFTKPREHLYQSSRQAAYEAGFKIIFENTERFVIVAQRAALFGRGSSIMIVIAGDGSVSIKSESASLYDWGRNRRNVHAFFEKLWNKC